MAYLGSKASFSIDMTKVKTSGNRKVFWVDPRTGNSVFDGQFSDSRQRIIFHPQRMGGCAAELWNRKRRVDGDNSRLTDVSGWLRPGIERLAKAQAFIIQ
jgi:hypothetical protein